MRRVKVGHSKEGYSLHIQDAPRWAYTVEAIAGSWAFNWVHRLYPITPWPWDVWQWLMSTTDRHQTGSWWVPCDETTAHAMSAPGTWDYVDSTDEKEGQS